MVIRFLFYILGFGIIAAVMLLGGDLAAFLDLASVTITLGGSAVFTLAAHGPSRVWDAISAGFRQDPVEQDEASQHARVLQSLRGALIGTGVIAFLIGGVHMLQHMDDPSQIGPAVAVALLSVLYSVTLAELIVAPMKHAVLSCAE